MTWVWGAVNVVLTTLVIYGNCRGWRWLHPLRKRREDKARRAQPSGKILPFGASVEEVEEWLRTLKEKLPDGWKLTSHRVSVDGRPVSGEPPSPILSAPSGAEVLANMEEWLRKSREHLGFSSWTTPWFPVCTATRSNGNRCWLVAVKGEEVCRLHLDRRSTAARTEEDGGLSFVDDPLPPPYAVPFPYGGMVAKHQPVDDEQAALLSPGDVPPSSGWRGPKGVVVAFDEKRATPPGSSTDMIASTGDLTAAPADPPGGCLICPADVPQTELIDHLISHHPDVYDGTAYETWPVEDVTDQGGKP